MTLKRNERDGLMIRKERTGQSNDVHACNGALPLDKEHCLATANTLDNPHKRCAGQGGGAKSVGSHLQRWRGARHMAESDSA
jgi:hypothetical protein